MVGLALMAFMTIRLGILQLGDMDGYPVTVTLESAAGIKRKAPVEMAGIQIGTVEQIQLKDGQAQVTLVIDKDVVLTSDAVVTVQTKGILGDKYVAVQSGSHEAARVQPGGEIAHVKGGADMDNVLGKISDIADDVKVITSSLKVSLASAESQHNIQASLDNIRELTDVLRMVVVDNQQRLSSVIVNLERFTSDISEVAGQNKLALGETIQNFRDISGQLGETIQALNSVAQKIDQGQGSIGALVNERTTVDDLNATLSSLKDISRKIDEGQGTIGRLVNDDTTIEKLDESLTGISNYLTRADQWRVAVDYRGEYLFRESSMRSTLNLRLQPQADKFFLVGIVDDPRGTRSEHESWTTKNRNGQVTNTYEHYVEYDESDLAFNVQIGKRFYDITGRAGLFASRGGFAVDYHMFDDALALTLEVSDFRTDYNPRLKFGVDYKFWKYFYVTTGYDDFISEDGRDSFFLGFGVTFFDEDIKFLLTSAPVP